LANLSIDGVYPWQLVRMNLYYKLTRRFGLFDFAHPGLKLRNNIEVDRKLKLKFHIRSLVLRGASWRDHALGRKRAVVLGNGRRIAGIEPYTEALLDEIANRSLLVEPDAELSAYPNAWDYRSLFKVFRDQKKHVKRPKFEHLDGLFKEVERFLNSESLAADNALDVAGDVSRAVYYFNIDKAGFRSLFHKNKTEALYVLNAYSRAACVAAAKELECRVIELQHGFISRYHLGYSWPGSPQLAYAPDELWCFGPAWCEDMDLPAGVRTRSIGAPYIERYVENRGEKNDRLVVFTSQGVLGKRLLDIAIDVAMRRPDLEIVFRLHPNEILESYEAEMSHRSGVPENFSISHRDPSIFDLLARARFQVGSFSTTLIEGMAVGAIPIVLRMPGCEYMEDIVRARDALFAENAEEVSRLLSAPAGREPDFRRYYAVPAEKLVL